MNTSYNPSLGFGKRIMGKWNGASYRIERGLGEGANGKVYLVSKDESFYALKVGLDAADLQTEANILKVLSQMEGSFHHFLADVDDYQEEGKEYPFYVMKYIKGLQLQEFLDVKGRDWFPLVGLHLLEKLCELHQKGFVFGDLKKENVMVSDYGHVDLVDFGGVTAMGKAVKQFTELYDRGYWNAGIRCAEESYDLFSFAVLCIHVCGEPDKAVFSKTILPQNRSLEDLLEEVRKDPSFKEYAPFITKALRGEFASTREAFGEWSQMLRRRTGHRMPLSMAGRHPAGWIKAGFALSALMFATALWYYW